MARRKNAVAPPVQPKTCSTGCGFCGWALRRIAFVYILFITLFTCPTSPDHFVCRAESLAYSTLVTPIHNYLLSTETGSRVHTAYNAHLVPFYEKHAVPVVDAAHSFVLDTAKPALCKATKPACDAVLRVVEPHREKVAAAYGRYLGPVVEVTGGAVGKVVNGWVLPVVNKVQVWVVPKVGSAVSDYLVPFFRDTVMPRWNEQVKPALCRYSKIVVQYTRSEILPAIADGAGRAYAVSRDFAVAHVVPHAKRATVHTYVFLKKHVLPPISRLYEQNLKEYVDRVVPWEQVRSVGGGVWVFVKGFVEEFYFMCYTIATGDEHPLVVARMKVVERVEVKAEDVGQIQGLARKVSGSARQWIQAARGWLGEAKNSYESRVRATVDSQKSQATEVVAKVKSTVSTPAAATPAFAKTIMSTPAAATPAVVPTVSTPAASTAAAAETTVSTPAVAEMQPTEPLPTEKDAPVIAAEEVVKSPDAHVASFAGVDTEDIAEPVAEAPVSTELPAAEPTEEAVPVVEYVEDTVLAASAVEEPVEEPAEEPVAGSVDESLVELEEQVPDVADEGHVVSKFVLELPVAVEEEPVAEQLPVDVPTAEELPPVLTSEPTVDIVETTEEVPAPVIDIVEEPVLVSEPTISAFETSEAIPEPVVSVIETPKAVPEPVIRIVEAPVVVLDRIIEAPVVVPEPAFSIAETPVETPAPIVPPVAVTPEEEVPVSPTAEQETTSLVAETTSLAPPSADDAASAVYEARDVMAGVLVSDDERAVFDDLVKSANKVAEGADKLEQFPSVLNDLEDTLAETPSVAPFVPQTTVPPTAPGQVDEDVRKAASNWVKDARESISKELAQERTRSGTLDEPEDIGAEEPVVPVAETTAPAEPRRVPVVEKPADLPTRPTTPVVVAKPPPVEEKLESVKRLKKPAVDTASEATTKGPRKVKKVKKRVVKKSP